MDSDTMVETWSGRFVDLARPHPDDIDIDDIATSLARLARFNGHTRHAWTVAQHSILVARLLDENIAAARWGLLHDAHEAYIGDISTPVKIMVEPEIDLLAYRLDEAIIERFGIHASGVVGDQVRLADRWALGIEASRLMASRGNAWPQLVGVTLPRLWPAMPLAGAGEEAIRQGFLDEFDRLFPGVR
jgi:uncharacterized protein